MTPEVSLAGAMTWAGPIDLVGPAYISGGDTVLSGPITSSSLGGSLLLDVGSYDGAPLELSNASNTYSGGTTVQGTYAFGAILADHDSSFGTGPLTNHRHQGREPGPRRAGPGRDNLELRELAGRRARGERTGDGLRSRHGQRRDSRQRSKRFDADAHRHARGHGGRQGHRPIRLRSAVRGRERHGRRPTRSVRRPRHTREGPG